MPNPTINDVVRIKHYCQFGNQFSQNVYLYEITTLGGVGLTEAEIAEGWFNVAGALLLPTMPTNVMSYGASCKKVYPLPQGQSWFHVGAAPGTSPGTNVAPPQVAPLISLRSDKPVAGNATRGRHYMPFTARDNIAAGVLTPGALTLYQNFLPVFTGTVNLTAGANTIGMKYCWVDVANIWHCQQATIDSYISQQSRRSFFRSGDQVPSS